MTIYHTHHIVPRHMGGTDDTSNLVKLNIEQHAEAHRQLYEQYGHWQDRLAWKALSGQLGKEDIIKQKLIEAGKKSKRIGPLKQSHRDNISKAKKGKPRPDILGGNHGRAKAVCCSGVYFGSVVEAAAYLNISTPTLRSRIKSDKWDYEYSNS